jgi:hypothetical protein
MTMSSPSQFEAGFQATQAVKDLELHENAQLWTSIFSAIAVIVNRETPPHLDDGGAVAHSDLLLSAGDHTEATLQIPDIGAVLKYDPGTAVVITGRVLTHSVPKLWKGVRICLAHYMKDKVHDRLKVPRPSLVNIKDYDALIAPGYSKRVR